LPRFSLLLGKFCEFPIGSGFVLKEKALSLAIDFVAIQRVLVRPVSVVRGRCAIVGLTFALVFENWQQLAT
jgi:hypothetical protein